ncbi:MAG: adenylosuccinate synthase [Sandaracinaceae bacterium]|nr:adenylosuccinate synthase [Sandaracinaceae bacterium]
MPALVVVGAQWGDEGKGKIVDLYTPFADLVVRFAGGANAGHTLVVGGEKVILHLIPSGILHEGSRCVVAQGTVLDPEVLLREIDELEARGVSVRDRLFISDRAHVVLPQHKLVDGLREAQRGDGAIGTTKRGIGPTYEDKVGRRGVRIGDLIRPSLLEKIEENLEGWAPLVKTLGGELPDAQEVAKHFSELGERLRPFITDTAAIVHDAVKADRRILLEGAQGMMLDIDHGTYPFVTSSNAVAGGACAGAGIGPTAIEKVVGISKAYATRVGGGPFPSELLDETGDELRNAGGEFGSTTGRPRRCGWLDLPALRMAARVNGMSELALTKLDVLTGFKELKVCVAYELDGERLLEPPFDCLGNVKAIYETLPGWDEAIDGARSRNALPESARRYVELIEKEIGIPVSLISVGPDREQTISFEDPFAKSARR